MPRRNSTIVVVVLLAACLIGVIVAWAYFRPAVTFQVKHELVGPADECVWALLRNGAPLDDIKQAVRETGKHPDQMIWVGGSLLSNAVDKQRKDLVIWLIEQGANPNGVHPSTSPLVIAIWNEDPQMVRLLIEHGANPDMDMGDGMTPRSIAKDRGKPEVIKAIKQSSTSDMPSSSGK